MLKRISFTKDYKLSEITTIKAFIRFHFNSVVFFIELINKILLKRKDRRNYSFWMALL